MGEQLVVGHGLSRTFGQGRGALIAIREATFSIGPGDRIGVVGPSGSGKSTLLHLIAALDRPTSGTIEWPGLGSRDALRPNLLSLAFQGPSLLPPLSVEENVALPLLLAGEDEAAALGQSRELLERFELVEVGTKLPEELSGGQGQRAALARALVGHPKLVLADEPTGQQDRITGRRAVETLLDQISLMGAALVVATHDLEVADRLPIRWSFQDRRLVMGVALRSA